MHKYIKTIAKIATLGTGTALLTSGINWACSKVYKRKPLPEGVQRIIHVGMSEELKKCNTKVPISKTNISSHKKTSLRPMNNCTRYYSTTLSESMGVIFENIYVEIVDFIEELFKHAETRISNSILRREFEIETLHILRDVSIPSMLRIIPDSFLGIPSRPGLTAENIHSQFCKAEKSIVHAETIFCNCLIGKYGRILQGQLDPGPARELVDRIHKTVAVLIDKMRDLSHNFQRDLTTEMIERSSVRSAAHRQLLKK